MSELDKLTAPPSRGRQQSPVSVVPKRRDSSLRATSSNPRVRSSSIMDIASRNVRHRTPIDFRTKESKAAMSKLRVMFFPVVLRAMLWRRRRRKYKGGVYPPRTYTPASVVSAIASSKTILAQWPGDLLETLAQQATFHYLLPRDNIIYMNESHISTGIVVLLHGQLSESRIGLRNAGTRQPSTTSTPNSTPAVRPISSQRTRTRYGPDVICVMPVLCEDRSLTSLSCQTANECADVAVIPSRWFWQVFHSYVLESPQAGVVLDSFRQGVLPQRAEMVISSYYPTSVLLQRSWIWPSLSGSDRVKLARAMTVRVLGMGDLLCEEGLSDRCVYFVRRGSLTLVVKGEPLAVVEAGTAFGEESVLFGDPRCSSLVASSVCELYCLDVADVRRRVDKYPKLLDGIVRAALERRRRWLEDGRVRDIFGLVSLLGGVPCLSHATDTMREEIARTARAVTVPAGKRITARDSPCTALFVLGRGAVRLGATPDGTAPGGELCSAGDFFGELCLRNHSWPLDIVAKTSVDVWVLDASELRRILAASKADVQAEEVCRQGIALYRTQHGEDSIKEEFDEPRNSVAASASASGGSRRASSSHRQPSIAPVRASTARPPPSQPQTIDLAKEVEGFDWVEYCRDRLALAAQEAAAQGDDPGRRPQPVRELQAADKAIEKALSQKVLHHISVPRGNASSPADSDFPGEVSELQTIIVEQLLLIPSDEQPKFLRQIGNSNVKLVAADEDDHLGRSPFGTAPSGGMTGNFDSIADFDENPAFNLAYQETFFAGGDMIQLRARPELASGDDSDTDADATSGSQPFALAFPPALFSRRSICGPDDSGFFGLPLQASGLPPQRRASVSRSHLIRPPSGMPVSPRSANPPPTNPLTNLMSPRAASIRPPSSSEPRLPSGGGPGSARARPSSVDYSQQNKISAERSQSVLDHYVKIEDKDYLKAFVKVLPLQQDELWIPDDDGSDNGLRPDALILALMHVRGCDHLAKDAMRKCVSPVVKVTTGSGGSEKVLLRAPFPAKANHLKPEWPIEVSSFITFVPHGAEVHFAICEAGAGGAQDRPVYVCALSTSEIGEHSGIGQRVMSLRPVPESGTNGSQRKEWEKEESSASASHPRMTVAMLTATASKYKSLHEQLQATGEAAPPRGAATDEEPNVSYLQIIGVEDLKHRVEASVTVALHSEGTTRHLLTTPRIVPKTRTPCWSASAGLLKITGDGFVTFSLKHKDLPIGSCETTADELVFGGTGLRRLPLMLSGGSSEVIGCLVVRVLATSTPAEKITRDDKSVILVYTEQFAMSAEAAAARTVAPDPFVVLRDGAGEPLLRTPVSVANRSPVWAPDEAACFVPCPVLAGSGVGYRVEVRDMSGSGGAEPLLGSTSLIVTRDGLGPQTRYDVPLEGRKGTVRVTAMRLAVHRPLAPHDAQEPRPHTAHFSKDDALALVHVAGCRDLRWYDPDADAECDAGGGSVGPSPLPGLGIDAIVTMRVAPSSWSEEEATAAAVDKDDGQPELMRTCIATVGRASPRWLLQDRTSAALLRVAADDLSRGLLDDAVAVFSVYDGLVNEVDLVGRARVPLARLLGTNTHHLTLRPPALLGAGAADSAVGTLQLATLCGRLNGQVVPQGGALPGQQDGGGDAGKPQNGGAATPLSPGVGAEARWVQLRLSCVTNLTPAASGHAATLASVTVGSGQKVLLRWENTTQGAVVPIGAGSAAFSDSALGGPESVMIPLAEPGAPVHIEVTVAIRSADAAAPAASFTLHAHVPRSVLAGVSATEPQLFAALLTSDGSPAALAAFPKAPKMAGNGPEKKAVPPELSQPAISLAMIEIFSGPRSASKMSLGR